ncbi:hypothetical protein QE152_g34804 [Popillia japonica]|uniref:Reverse transcriptase domain-containing protein n=1 Tax=Popillia japonica TaxID=7064 RepID=A0AAW1ISR3_POPJA
MGNALDLIKSYLTNRKQRIEAGNGVEKEKFSEWRPQISVYPTILYADDSSIILKTKNALDVEIANTLGQCESWFTVNDLKLNVNKTTLLHFSYFKQTPITVDYKSQLLTSAESGVVTQMVNLYNHIPVRLKNLDIPNFKHKLRTYFIQQAFYNVNEFYNVRMQPRYS